MAAALTAAVAGRATDVPRVAMLRDRLADGLLAAIEGATETGRPHGAVDRGGKVAGICHLLIPGVEQEELLLLADDAGVFASAGAACASGALEPSHVLVALGLSGAEARSAVRFSLGSSTTEADVETALDVIPKVVEQLRR
jgi:cysteine desulfurase